MTISMASIRSFTFAILAGLTLAGCGYNTIPTLEEQAKAKWGDVQNNYQRRADLIPNLVSTVQGYAKQERDVLTSVIEARAKATQIKVDASQLTDGKGQAVPGCSEPVERCPWPTHRRERELSRAQIQPELPCPPVSAGRHRKSHCGCAPRLHRGRACV